MSIGFLFKNTQDENIEMDSDKIKKYQMMKMKFYFKHWQERL